MAEKNGAGDVSRRKFDVLDDLVENYVPYYGECREDVKHDRHPQEQMELAPTLISD